MSFRKLLVWGLAQAAGLYTIPAAAQGVDTAMEVRQLEPHAAFAALLVVLALMILLVLAIMEAIPPDKPRDPKDPSPPIFPAF